MDTKLVTEKYRASQWMEIIKDRKDSGLGVDEYCKINGISNDGDDGVRHQTQLTC